MKRKLLLSVLTVATLLGAQTAPGQKSRVERGRDFLGLAPPADPEAAARGQKIFAQACAFCHGQNATGAEGPDLLRSSIVLHDEKGELIGPFLLKGRPDKGMPAFGMNAEQTYNVAEFLHARVEAAANRYGYKMQNLVTGDAKAGEIYFKGAGKCAACHSSTGDLAHIASRLEPPDLQAQFLYPDKKPAPSQVSVTLSSGQTITGTLKKMDDFDISIYDSEGNYRAWPRELVKVSVKDSLAAHRELLANYTDKDIHNLLAYLETLK